MGIPNNDQFEKFFNSLSAEPPKDASGWSRYVCLPRQQLHEDGFAKELPEVAIWFRDGELSIESVLRKINAVLQSLNHRADLSFAAAALLIFAHAKREGSAVQKFNGLFDHVVSADLTQYALLREVNLPNYRFRVGPFTLGPFGPDKLAYRSDKAGSDFFHRYAADLRSLPFAVERDHRPVRVIFWNKLFEHWPREKNLASLGLIAQALDYYFARLSDIYFRDFFAELNENQEIPMALGSGWFDFKQVQSLFGAHFVSVYLNVGDRKTGFVSTSAALAASLNLGGGHLGIPFTEVFLNKTFSFDGITSCEIHQTLKTFCHFLALAADHQSSGRKAEGFLHYVIALDLLLGDRKALSASVSSRCSALTHGALNKSFTDTEKLVEEIYDARSRYVHKGEQPDPALLPVAESISREVAFCLFRLQQAEANRKPGFSAGWLKEVDYTIAALKAQREISLKDWENIGSAGPGMVRYDDFRRELCAPESNQSKQQDS